MRSFDTRMLSALAGVALLAIGVGAGAKAWADPADDVARRAAEQKQRIDQIGEQMKGSAAEQERLKAEITAIKDDRARLTTALLDAATRIRGVEQKQNESEGRLLELTRQETDIRRSLDSRRGVLAEVLGGLARLGRDPPPALLVRPDDALDSVRSAMVLGAVLPELKQETEILVNDLAALDAVRKQASAERDALAELKASMGEERRRLAALVEQRQKNLDDGEVALQTEQQRAEALAAEASNVRELLARMETEVAAAKRAAEAAKAAENKPQQGPGGKLAALQDPGRLSPSIAFADARGTLNLPAGGSVVKAFGTSDGFGGQEKGVTFGTRPEAQVSAPCDGWVVYAGPFRSYGQLLIINAGGGYHILLAGMDKITVELGQFVLSGEPVAVMGQGPRLASSVGLGTAQPILYVEFRKDGDSIDPTPWWATSESEKVRG